MLWQRNVRIANENVNGFGRSSVEIIYLSLFVRMVRCAQRLIDAIAVAFPVLIVAHSIREIRSIRGRKEKIRPIRLIRGSY